MKLSDEVDLYVRGMEKPPSRAEAEAFKVICERTGLSPIARQIYLVGRGGRFTAQVSIDGFRAIAARSERYVGQDGPHYVTSADGEWTDIPPEGAPYAAKVGVKMLNPDGSLSITFAVAKWKDYNAGGPMWGKFPATMLAKCAESLALRKAFPTDMAGLYTAEEMAQAGPKNEPPVTFESIEAAIAGALAAKSIPKLQDVVRLAEKLPEDQHKRARDAIREAATVIRTNAVG